MRNRLQYWMDKIDRGDTWLSNKLEVDRATVYKWRKNRSQPSSKNMIKIAAFFECDIKDLIE